MWNILVEIHTFPWKNVFENVFYKMRPLNVLIIIDFEYTFLLITRRHYSTDREISRQIAWSGESGGCFATFRKFSKTFSWRCKFENDVYKQCEQTTLSFELEIRWRLHITDAEPSSYF